MCTSGHCVVSLTCSGFCVSYDDYYSYTYYYSDTPAIVGGVVGDVLGLLLIISVIVVIIVVRPFKKGDVCFLEMLDWA